jgi:farnesyl-diphosphate farnesyltransferase
MSGIRIDRLLREHARTFALTLGLLPQTLRETLGLAYLLARASDTVADSGILSVGEKISLLQELHAALARNRPADWNPSGLPDKFGKKEEELIQAVPQFLASLDENPDRREVIALWQSILEGQRFDLQRFPSSHPLSRDELECYCGSVAGSVGKTWTILIEKHAPGVLLRPSGEMQRLGFAYGMGLQLINILRDRAEDRALGRLYVCAGELLELLALAEQWLGCGARYLEGLRPGRILMASSLPHDLAMRTLREITCAPNAARVSIPRREVHWLVIRGLLSLCLPRRMNPAS